MAIEASGSLDRSAAVEPGLVVLCRGMNASLAENGRYGQSIVFDPAITQQSETATPRPSVPLPFPVLLVGVRCSAGRLERRGTLRRDRSIGSVVKQLEEWRLV